MSGVQKYPKTIRPHFRKLLKEYKTLKGLGDFLGAELGNINAMKRRGFMSKAYALLAEKYSNGEYKARLLCKQGRLK